MKTLLIIFAYIGCTLSEKLDRTYLPPPGSKFSGGSPGEIYPPLEFPKETYPSSTEGNQFGRPEIAIGIDRIGPNTLPENYEDSSTAPSFLGTSHGFPTTTTSYAFSQTTSYLPATGTTIRPEISMNFKYPLNKSMTNPNSDYLREKYHSLDHVRPDNIYNEIEKNKMLNDVNNQIINHLPHDRINTQEVKEISDENVHSYNDNINRIPEINTYSGNKDYPGITSSPTESDHSLLNKKYDPYHSPSPSEPINQQIDNLISTTPTTSDNAPSQYISNSQINIKITPYSYHTLPERMQAQNDREAVILNYDNTITPNGYAYSFDTSNGIHADEKGTATNGVRAMGSYSYIGDDGQMYTVNYTADENGFRPYGAHLPTAPPIPDAILKVIQQAAIDKANGIYDDGSYDENKYGYQKYNPTKNNQFLNKYNKDIESTNFSGNIGNNQLNPYTKLDRNFNKEKAKDNENKHDVTNKNSLQELMKPELFDININETLFQISPKQESDHFENNGKEHIEGSNDDNNYKFKNNRLNSIPHSKYIGENDSMANIDFYDQTGYHYSKPQNNYSSKAADILINRFSETPDSNTFPTTDTKIGKTIPARPFMTPYVTRNDDSFTKHDESDQSIDIPRRNHNDENIESNNQNTNPFPTLTDTNVVRANTENGMNHNFINEFKQPNISSYDQGYYYSKKINSNNNIYIPSVTSTEIGLSDSTSTLPTAFPSRFNTIEPNNDNNSGISPKHSEQSVFQNQSPSPNRPLDEEKYRESLTYYNYVNPYNDDPAYLGSRYNTTNRYEADKDYNIEHSTSKTYNGEDFSGPKQKQGYDPLTGYHY